jgi:uncharacterized protein (DUF2236 family)
MQASEDEGRGSVVPDVPPNIQLFGPTDQIWEIAGDQRFALMFGSAFALQLMHPQVASAVATQSNFMKDPWGRATRSLTSVQKWIYGGQAALEEGARLVAMHRSIRGVDDRGRRYNALDPAPWAWVPLTAFYSSVVGFPYFYGRTLTPDEEALGYQEGLRTCRILRVPERMLPPTVADYWSYFDDMAERTLRSHEVVHQFIHVLKLAPPPPWMPRVLRASWGPLRAAGHSVLYLAIVGLLRPKLRALLGLSWSLEEERRLTLLGRAMAEIVPRLPERLRFMPIAYRARVAARANARLERALRV